MLTFQSWSGGKDSTASIILEHLHGLPKSMIIMSEVMFDNDRGISGESPEHIQWIRKVAIPTFESWGYNVKILRSEKDFLDIFFHKPAKSKNPERRDKYSGFLLGGMCTANRDLKIKPIRDFLRSVDGEFIQYVGIAADEQKRLKRLDGTNKISLLAEYGYTEKMAFDLCEQFDLLSPIYSKVSRGGCWFCPNSSFGECAYIKQTYPELWHELDILSHSENLISSGFKYGLTFSEVDAKVDEYIRRQRIDSLQIDLDL